MLESSSKKHFPLPYILGGEVHFRKNPPYIWPNGKAAYSAHYATLDENMLEGGPSA